MRKDVRLALAVGSVLLFAVVVYVLFFTNPGTNKTGTPKTGGAAGGAIAQNTNGGTTNSGAAVNDGRSSAGRPADPAIVPAPGVSDGAAATRPADPVVMIPPTPAPSPTPNLTPLAKGETFDWGGAAQNGWPANGGTRAEGTGGTPTPSPAPSPTPGGRKYTVKPNETLWGIARAEYGNAAYVNHIIRANPGIDANRLRAATVIILPEKTEVVPETGPARLATAGPTTRPIDTATQYRVQSGDNLFTIAKKLYGNVNRAGKLYEANKDLIGPNPNALKLNMVLRLPDPPTSATTPATPLSTSHSEGTSPAVSDLR